MRAQGEELVSKEPVKLEGDEIRLSLDPLVGVMSGAKDPDVTVDFAITVTDRADQTATKSLSLRLATSSIKFDEELTGFDGSGVDGDTRRDGVCVGGRSVECARDRLEVPECHADTCSARPMRALRACS